MAESKVESQLESQMESQMESQTKSKVESKEEIEYINEILENLSNIKKAYVIESVKDPQVSELINIVTGIENNLLGYKLNI